MKSFFNANVEPNKVIYSILLFFLILIFGLVLSGCKKVDDTCTSIVYYDGLSIPTCSDYITKEEIMGEWVLVNAKQVITHHTKGGRDSIDWFWFPDSVSIPLYYNSKDSISSMAMIGEKVNFGERTFTKYNTSFDLTYSIGATCDINKITINDIGFRPIFANDSIFLLETCGQTPTDIFSGEQFTILEYKKSVNSINSHEFIYVKDNVNDFNTSGIGIGILKYNEVGVYSPITIDTTMRGKWVFESYQKIKPYGGEKMILNDTIEFFDYYYNIKNIKRHIDYIGRYSVFESDRLLKLKGLNIFNHDIIGNFISTGLVNNIKNLVDIEGKMNNSQTVRIVLKRI